MWNRGQHQYTAVPLQEIIVVKNPANQLPNSTERSPSATAQQMQGNGGQPSTAEQLPNGTECRPSATAQQMQGNGGQPSTAEQLPNGTERSPSATAQQTPGNGGQPSTAEQLPNGTECRPSATAQQTQGNGGQPSIADQLPNGTERSPSATAQQMPGNGGQPSTADQLPNDTERSPSATAQQTQGNGGQPSIADQLPNGTERSPSATAQQTPGNGGQPSIAEQHPSGTECRPTTTAQRKQPSENERPTRLTEHPHNKHERKPITAEQSVNVCTELHSACKILDSERVSILLEQGSNVNALEEQWLTPLDVAGENIPTDHNSPVESFLNIIKALVERGGRPTTVKEAKYRDTPLHVAVSLACEGGRGCDDCSQCLQAIDILVKAGYDKPLQSKGVERVYVKGAARPTDKEVRTSLHAAVQRKWLAGVNALLGHGADVNARVVVPGSRSHGASAKHKRGENALHVAVHKQWPEGVDALIRSGAETEVKLSTFAGGFAPLHMASQRLDFGCLERLLKAGADPNSLDSQGLTPLDVVGEHAYNKPVQCFLQVIEALIAKGGKPTSVPHPKYRETPVHLAVGFRSSEAIHSLYDAGYKKLFPNKSGNTPLHVVTSQQSEEYFNLLVSLYKSTGLDAGNKLGETALHLAVRRMWLEGARTLLDAGADITLRTRKDKTVLHLVPNKRNYVMMKELLKHKHSHKIVNERDICKNLPLFDAIFAKHDKCAFLLVANNADLTLTHGDNKSTVLHAAISARQPKILKGLFKHGKPDVMDTLKESTVSTKLLKDATPLLMAVFTNSPECVEILIDNKCNLKAETIYENKTFTAFELATRTGYEKVLKALLEGDPSLVNTPDATGMMPIHWACIQHHSKAIKVIADAGCDLSARCDHKGDECKSTAMDLFLSRVPGSVALLEEILDSAITVHKERIEFDYKMLMPEVNKESKQLKVIDALVQTGDQVNQSRLFTHPVIETFLRLQWERMRKFYISVILAFLVFLVIPFNVLVMVVFYFEYSLSEFPVWSTILLTSMVAGFIVYITHEILYFYFETRNSRYFCQWKFSKEVNLFIFNSVISVLKIGLISILLFLPFTNPQEKFFRELSACAVIMLWFEFMLFMSRVPTYGIYMLMFFKVRSNFFVIMLSFTFLFLGFVTTFLVEYRGKQPFDSIPEAFLKTLVMMTTIETEYASLFTNIDDDAVAYTFSKIVFLIFLLIVGIVIMNIVLAKAILDVKKVDRLRQQAEFLSIYEQLLFFNPFIVRLNALFGHSSSTSMKMAAIETKLYIRFDEANRFHNTLMQSIMERAFIVSKCRQEVPKDVEVKQSVKVGHNKINIQLDGIMEMNKSMMETINTLAKKLDIYTQLVDRNTEHINQLSHSVQLLAQRK